MAFVVFLCVIAALAGKPEASGSDGIAIYEFDSRPYLLGWSVGFVEKTVLGFDGRPASVLSHQVLAGSDPNPLGLSLVQCLDLACSAATVYAMGEFPQYPGGTGFIDLAIGSDGNPIVAFAWAEELSFDEFEFHVVVIACRNPECSDSIANEILRVLVSSPGGWGYSAPAIVAGPDGNPLIAFGWQERDIDTGGQPSQLVTIQCLDIECNDTATTDHPELGDLAGEAVDVVVPPDGRPVIAYRSSNPDTADLFTSLYIGRCADFDCSTIEAHLVHEYQDLSDPGDNKPITYVGRDIEMTIGADGQPIVAYVEQYLPLGSSEIGDLWVARCIDETCSSFETNVVDGVETIQFSGETIVDVEELSITVGPGGHPVLHYRVLLRTEFGFWPWGTMLSYCDDAACRSATRQLLPTSDGILIEPSVVAVDTGLLMTTNDYINSIAQPAFVSCTHVPCDENLSFPGAVEVLGEAGHDGRFVDDDGNTHESNIEAIADIGVTLGCTVDGLYYCPADPVTRAQMASFLVRAFAIPAAGVDYFPDDNGNTHEANINALREAEITFGCGDGTNYCPNDLVSRAQMASFIARVMGLVPIAGDSFTDVSGTHAGSIYAIRDAGITLGCNPAGTQYCPNVDVPRDQMASFIARALGIGA